METGAKSNKKCCSIEGCKNRVVAILGHCKACNLDHCQSHRLPEAHNCANLQSVKDASHAKLSMKLMNEKTSAAKV